MTYILELLRGQGAAVEPCGSRVTCEPPPVDTDEDWLVQLLDNDRKVSDAVSTLTQNDFRWEGSEHYQSAAGTFMSWRKGNLNLIVTRDAGFAGRHRAATSICKRLNLLRKEDRIAVFQAVLYGNAAL